MSPFQIYIGIEREVRKYKEGLKLSSADITYFLNKALNEFVDTRANEFDSTEELKRALGNLVTSATVASSTVTNYDTNTRLNAFAFADTSTRRIVSERVTMTIGTTATTVAVKPITLDQLNTEVKDPFSTYKVRLGECKPLRYDSGNGIVLVGQSTYSLTNYICVKIINPTPFTIASASDVSEYTQLPVKTHTELITIAARQIIENESANRYQAYNIEEIKSKS
jgi:hypothetical protein